MTPTRTRTTSGTGTIAASPRQDHPHRTAGVGRSRHHCGHARSAPRRGAGTALLLVIAVGLLFQVGSALGVRVIGVGVIEALWLRTALGALMLIALRPRSLRLPARGHRTGLVALTFALFGMNLFFYEAISRTPLGIVVTIEFLGPLAVAVLGSRRPFDWVWIVLAGSGMVLLAGPSGSAKPLGLAFAFAAAGCWGPSCSWQSGR